MYKIFFLRSKDTKSTTKMKKSDWTEKMLMLIEKVCPDYAATMVYKSIYQHPNEQSTCYHGKSYTAIKKNGEKAYQLDNNTIKEINLNDYTKNKQNIDFKSMTPWAEWIIIRKNNEDFEYGYLIIAQLPGKLWNNNNHDDHISIHQSPALSCSLQIRYIRELIENYQKNTPSKIHSKKILDPQKIFRTKSAQSQRKIKKSGKNRARKSGKKKPYKSQFLNQFLSLFRKIYYIIITLKNYTSNLLRQISPLKYMRILCKYRITALNYIMYMVIMILKNVMFKKHTPSRFKKKQSSEYFEKKTYTHFKRNQPKEGFKKTNSHKKNL